MPFIGLLIFLILLWYPCYKYIIFVRLLRTQWFRKAFEVTPEKEEAFKMGLGASGLSSGFWFFYFFGFTLIATPILFFFIYTMAN